MDYGITNQKGMTPKNEIIKILESCKQHNLHAMDTAACYGKSEEILGELITDSYFEIYSKTPPLNVGNIDEKQIKYVEKTFRNSLNKLNVDHIEGIFIHNANDLFVKNSEELFQLLLKWKNNGLINKIGVCIYDEDELNRLLDNYDIDIFQIPINIYDQRLINSDILNKIKKKNTEIHARSVFLQGLLLADIDQLPNKFKTLIPIQQKLELFLYNHKLTKLEGALQFITQIKQLDRMVVGINNLNHLIEIVQSCNNLKDDYIDFNEFQVNNLDLIDPRRW